MHIDSELKRQKLRDLESDLNKPKPTSVMQSNIRLGVDKLLVLSLALVALSTHFVLVLSESFRLDSCRWNYGVSFGLLSGDPDLLFILNVILLILISVFLIKTLKKEVWGYVFVMSGVGNLVDRVLYGAVCDYIDLSTISKVLDFIPVFNLNDLLISISLIFIGKVILFEKSN